MPRLTPPLTPPLLLLALGLSGQGPAFAQTGPCPPHVRCHQEQHPPARNELQARRRLETEEAAAVEAGVLQRETAAIRQQEARAVEAERRAAWIDRGRLKEAPAVRLQTPLFTLTPSGRASSATGKSAELGVSTGIRYDGIALELGRLAFELEAVVGSRDTNGVATGTLGGDASVLWIGEHTALPFARVGASLGRFVSGPADSTPDGFYRIFLGLGVDNYFIPLGAGRGAGFAFEARVGLLDAYGGSAALSKARAELQLMVGPRLAF